MSPRGGQPKMVQQGRETRGALLDAAATVVHRAGYAGANIRAIAAEAGVAVGTIFRHYPNKAALLAAVVERETVPVLEALGDLPGRAGTCTVAGNLVEVMTTLALLQEVLLPFELAFLTDPELAAQRRQLMDSKADLPGVPTQLAQYLAAEQTLGRVRTDIPARHCAHVLLATMFGLAANPTSEGPSLPSAVAMFVEGIAPDRDIPTPG
ncbi:MAG: TetR/AcrR family transcriptional regulator [Actinomycetota bacterium]|nr:TetR/AcrR family transcriptional regulator [Actinomycetota bacterium]